MGSVNRNRKQRNYPSNYMPIVVMWGQSNEDYGDVASAPPASIYTAAQANCKVWYKPTETSAIDGTFVNLQYGVNNKRIVGGAGCGPELGLAYHLKNDYGINQFGLIKYSYGGSRMTPNGTYTYGYWKPDVTLSESNGFNHGIIHPSLFILRGMNKFKEDGYIPVIVAIHGCQGESDCGTTANTASLQWAANAQIMINKWRDLIGALYPSIKTAKIIQTRIHDKLPSGTNPNSPNVRAQNALFVQNMSGELIDSDGFTVGADSVHFTMQSQCDQHGKILASIVQKYIL